MEKLRSPKVFIPIIVAVIAIFALLWPSIRPLSEEERKALLEEAQKIASDIGSKLDLVKRVAQNICNDNDSSWEWTKGSSDLEAMFNERIRGNDFFGKDRGYSLRIAEAGEANERMYLVGLALTGKDFGRADVRHELGPNATKTERTSFLGTPFARYEIKKADGSDYDGKADEAYVELAPGSVELFSDESRAPAGFRDVKWGTPRGEIDGLKQVARYTDGHTSAYVREGDKMKIGDVDLERIEYRFIDDELSGVEISVRGRSDATEMLLVSLKEAYGDLLRGMSLRDGDKWRFQDVRIELVKSYSSAKLVYTYLPATRRLRETIAREQEERQKDANEAGKRGSRDL